MWVIVKKYYKYGDYKLTIIKDDNELKVYIKERLKIYNVDKNEYDDKCDILYLIDLIERIGNKRVENEDGWGIREIRYVC